MLAGDDAGSFGQPAFDRVTQPAGLPQPPEVKAAPLADEAVAVVVGEEMQQRAQGAEHQCGQGLAGVEGQRADHNLEMSATLFSRVCVWCSRARRFSRTGVSSQSTSTSSKKRSTGACKVARLSRTCT